VPGGKLTFVHLSDIHFILAFSSESPFDIDKPVRDAILHDAKILRPQLGPLSGVLITGDIAYAGKAGEYKTALDWLAQLTEILNCEREYLWCVPGNHDIDRSVLKENTAISAVHARLRQTADRNAQLRSDLEVENTGRLLFSPLKAYSEEFATRLGCLSHPKQPWWTDDLVLNDGSTLRLRGLNSALISADDKDEQNKLLLGAIQTEYGRSDGVEYLTLCHHPTDCLLDKDAVDEALLAYSRIQLFGHKHVQKVNKMDESLWLVAGAVHPERSKPNWSPRYNYLSIEVEGTGKDRYMSVDVYARVWSQTERQFTREQGGYKEEFRNYKLKLPEWWRPEMIAQRREQMPSTEPVSQIPGGAQTGMNVNRKKLLFRFIGLPHHAKVAIMKKFGLWEEIDQKLPDAEIFAACFERARGKGVLDAVWDAVEGQAGQQP